MARFRLELSRCRLLSMDSCGYSDRLSLVIWELCMWDIRFYMPQYINYIDHTSGFWLKWSGKLKFCLHRGLCGFPYSWWVIDKFLAFQVFTSWPCKQIDSIKCWLSWILFLHVLWIARLCGFLFVCFSFFRSYVYVNVFFWSSPANYNQSSGSHGFCF